MRRGSGRVVARKSLPGPGTSHIENSNVARRVGRVEDPGVLRAATPYAAAPAADTIDRDASAGEGATPTRSPQRLRRGVRGTCDDLPCSRHAERAGLLPVRPLSPLG